MAEPIDSQEIRYLGDVQRLKLRPADIVVLRLPAGMTLRPETRARLQAAAESQLDGHKVLILEDGMQIGVLSPVDEVTGIDAPQIKVRLDGSD